MMEALEAGGMEAVYSAQRDERMNKKWGDPDYKPNTRYYELEAEDYQDASFPSAYEGKLIKCLWGGMLRLRPVTEYRVIFMRRDTKAIQHSLTAFFGQPVEQAQNINFQRQLDNVVSILRDRRSVVSVHEVQYVDVVSNPLAVFEMLAREGWPIDPAKAAEIPQARKMRFAA
jgi:hypothetical protein